MSFVFLYYTILFGTPMVVLSLFAISLYRYHAAKKKNEITPGTVSDKELKIRKIMLIVFSIIAIVFSMIVIGFIILLNMAVAYM